MKILDLFSGYNDRGKYGFSAAFVDRGHLVVSVDINPKFETTIVGDVLTPAVTRQILEWGPYEGILAGPPCESFSVGAFRHNFQTTSTCRECGQELIRVPGEKWEHLGEGDCSSQKPGNLVQVPKSPKGFLGVELVSYTLWLVDFLNPSWWVMENPVGMLRKLPVVSGIPRVTIDQCKYGNNAKKPTDLWGKFPPDWNPRPRCTANRKEVVVVDGIPYRVDSDGICHEAGYRGSRFGTQGKANAALRGVIPYELSMDLCLASEKGV